MSEALNADVDPASPDSARQHALDWLTAFEAALATRETEAITALFCVDCHWRDILAFTWNFTAVAGREKVAARLCAAQERTQAQGFHLPSGRRAPRLVKRMGIDSIEAIFEFQTADGGGSGVVRLATDGDDEGGPRAWLISTSLDSLRGHEERLGPTRPIGSAYSRNFGGANWADMREAAVSYQDRDPEVLVIGAAQSGLSIAARLNQLGVDTLVVEKWPRVGDSWRKRYHALALHNSTDINHLPYLDFPPTWPRYIPKDMLANWLEFYAVAMEINCWTGTEFVRGEWDEADKNWTAWLRRDDGSERRVRARHLVFANGVSSFPLIPDLPGLSDFRGTVIHSEGFYSGAGWEGKNALVLGTGSSANDIALDLYSFGARVSLIQRGSTTVVSIDPSARLNEALWMEGSRMEDADLLVSSTTPTLMVEAYKGIAKRMLELDKDLIEGLERIGFKHDMGEDGTGHQMKYFRRGGGYNLDAGSSALMIKGEIGLLQFDRIERFVAEGALLKDGTTVPADLLVLATGYYPQQELVRRTLGDEVAAKIGPVWGFDAEDELNNMFKRTPHPGVWFIAGGLPQCRINSKYLALQIKATQLGLLGPLPQG